MHAAPSHAKPGKRCLEGDVTVVRDAKGRESKVLCNNDCNVKNKVELQMTIIRSDVKT